MCDQFALVSSVAWDWRDQSGWWPVREGEKWKANSAVGIGHIVQMVLQIFLFAGRLAELAVGDDKLDVEIIVNERHAPIHDEAPLEDGFPFNRRFGALRCPVDSGPGLQLLVVSTRRARRYTLRGINARVRAGERRDSSGSISESGNSRMLTLLVPWWESCAICSGANAFCQPSRRPNSETTHRSVVEGLVDRRRRRLPPATTSLPRWRPVRPRRLIR